MKDEKSQKRQADNLKRVFTDKLNVTGIADQNQLFCWRTVSSQSQSDPGELKQKKNECGQSDDAVEQRKLGVCKSWL